MDISEIRELMQEKRFLQTRRVVETMNEVDIAQIFEEIEDEHILILFRLLPKDTAAEIFSYIPPEIQKLIVEGLNDRELSRVLDDLFLDDTVDFIEEMPANVVKRVLKVSNEETRNLINQFLQYPEDSAGSIMTIEFVDLIREMTVAQAFTYIRQTGVDKETIYTCYVMDGLRKLQGVVTVKDLLLANPDDKIGDIMDENVIYAHTLDDKEHIAKLFNKYDMLALPIVDKDNRLVGIITIDDAVDVIQEEATEDFEKMAAIAPSEDTYLKTSSFTHAKKRIPWLFVLMVSSLFTGAIISGYEEAFLAVPALVVFLPMLNNTSGNCGSQASTMVIRGMALDEINFKDFFKVFFKEFRIAVIVGAALGVFNLLRGIIFEHDFLLGLTVGVTLFFTICAAKLIGGMLPLLAKRLKIDPAIMASPIIATISDAVTALLYFNVAKMILNVL